MSQDEIEQAFESVKKAGRIGLKEMSKEELAEVIAGLIREGGDLRNAVREVVWSCPNVVTEI